MKPVRLNVERLEERSVPAVFGNPWPDAPNLTLSFAPDGTAIEGSSNQLFQSLNQRMATPVWQKEILRAFQTWAVNGNINLGLISDSGKPFGEAGPVQGNPGYGDIRLGDVALSPDELAVSTPFDLFSGWAGEVLLNSNYSFTKGETSSSYDLFTVMLQEAGHVFGLPNSPDTASVMYPWYQGVRTGLHASDVANLQSLYGTRAADRFEGAAGNNTFAAATPISFVSSVTQFAGSDGSEGAKPFVARADLTTLSDLDYYRFTVPSGVTSFTARLRTSGVSLMTARLEVYDASYRLLKTVSATDPRNGDLSASISAKANAVYYVRVDGSTENVFGIGGYRLAVGTASYEALYPAPLSGLLNNDLHTDDTLASAAELPRSPSQAAKGWDYTHRASITGDGDVDFYRVVAPASGSVMLVNLWAMDINLLKPTVEVYDAQGQLMAAQVFSSDPGSYTIQVSNVVADSSYYVKVAAAGPLSGYNEGNYFLAVDFRAAAVQKENFVNSAVTQAEPQVAFALQTTRTALFRFILAANCTDSSVETGVRLVVYDADDRVLMTFFTRSGQTVSADLLLAAGTYIFRFIGGAKNRAAFAAPISFDLGGIVRTDPIGPATEDTTFLASGSVPSYSWTSTSLKTSWLSPTDPYSDPWNGL